MLIIYIMLGIALITMIHISHDISKVKKIIWLLVKGLSEESKEDD